MPEQDLQRRRRTSGALQQSDHLGLPEPEPPGGPLPEVLQQNTGIGNFCIDDHTEAYLNYSDVKC